jgi:hypothetical protein
MVQFNPFHWLVVLAVAFGFVIPIGKILKRTGHNPIWSVLCIFPPFALALLWVFAFRPWPIDTKSPT